MAAELSPDDKALLDLIIKRVCEFEDTLGVFYRDGLWSRMHKLYHSWTQLRRALRDTRGRDRDAIYDDARKEFGHELFIPHAYAIVETVVPALLSNRPRPLVLPRNEASERNSENMRWLIDGQASQCDLELRLQSVVKSALKLGLGVGKSYWLRREVERTRVVPSSFVLRMAGRPYALETFTDRPWDDPTFEWVRPEDFGWDPFASSIETCRYAWHRTWRDTAYVRERLQDGSWPNMELEPGDVESSNDSANKYRQSITGSFEAQAIPVPNPLNSRDTDVHEVLEYHDGDRIVTVLDRQWVVSNVANEVWRGRLPFHVFRPTEVEGQMVGKGEIEPVEDLQREMNDLRTDRRWAALMRLNPPLFAQEGLLDPDTIHVGPGELNMVNGDPKDIIWPLTIGDIPSSSVRETAEIASDIVRASGVSDTFAGGESRSQATATGVQLEMSRATARIQLKTRRVELEVLKPLTSHWGALNQRHILGARDVRIPAPPEVGAPDRRWDWQKLGPGELMGEFEYEPEGGSTAPENVPQMRQDAQFKMTLMSGPLGQLFDARQMAIDILENLGVKNAASRLQQGVIIPQETLSVAAGMLAELGMDPGMAQQVMVAALQETLDARDQQAQATDHGQGGPEEGRQQAA